MNDDTVATFLALLSLMCWAGVLVVAGLALGNRVHRGGTAERALAILAPSALWLGFLVAAVATAGSLWLSEGAGYVPCELCWYQRICMYPLSAILLVAAVRRDRQVLHYVGPLLVTGLAVAAYHTQLQAFPDQHSFCKAAIPCTNRYIWKFGFVSIPFMALAGFAWISAMVLVARAEDRWEQP